MATHVERDFSREHLATIRLAPSGRHVPLSEACDDESITLTFEEIVRDGVNAGLIPRYLYKYRAPDLKETEAPFRTTENIFSDNILWFGNPRKFNDPFDCQMTVDTNNSLEAIEFFIRKFRTEELRTSSDPTIRKEALEKSQVLALKMYNSPAEWSEYVHDYFYKQQNIIGVCCFSEEYDNILMWSHYANSHTGLCLKYDLLKDPYLFSTIMKVEYQANYPDYNLINGIIDFTFDASIFFKTKSKEWAYEKEWRVCKYDDEIGAFPFKKESLVEVVFGCLAGDKFISGIQEIANKSGMSHLKYKKAVVDKNSFKLNIFDL